MSNNGPQGECGMSDIEEYCKENDFPVNSMSYDDYARIAKSFSYKQFVLSKEIDNIKRNIMEVFKARD